MRTKQENCHHFLITVLILAGVAGFEPTNDGVRVRYLCSKMGQNRTKNPQKAPFFAIFKFLLPNLSPIFF